MKLERLQNYAGRVILKEHRVTSATSIRIELNWSTLKKRRHLHIATLMFKVINEMGPDYLAPLCTPASKVHNHDTRAAASGVLYLPRTATNFDRKAFSFCGPKIWNSLPSETRQLQNFCFYYFCTFSSFFSLVM